MKRTRLRSSIKRDAKRQLIKRQAGHFSPARLSLDPSALYRNTLSSILNSVLGVHQDSHCRAAWTSASFTWPVMLACAEVTCNVPYIQLHSASNSAKHVKARKPHALESAGCIEQDCYDITTSCFVSFRICFQIQPPPCPNAICYCFTPKRCAKKMEWLKSLPHKN